MSRLMMMTALLAVSLAAGNSLYAQIPLPPDLRHEVVDSIISPWEDWTEVTLKGKLKMDGLPVNPSVRIFMQRDSSIFISLRAPFVGEVGRAEITDSCALIVNKMKKIYVEEPLDKVFTFYPGGLSDLQNLFLGRAALPGLGILSHDTEESVDLYAEEDGTYSLVVSEDMAIPGVNYGYVFDSGYWPAALLVMPENKPDISFTITYSFYEKGYDMNFIYQSEKRNYNAILEFDDPDWEGRPFDRISLGSKYRKVDPKDFLKSF